MNKPLFEMVKVSKGVVNLNHLLFGGPRAEARRYATDPGMQSLARAEDPMSGQRTI